MNRNLVTGALLLVAVGATTFWLTVRVRPTPKSRAPTASSARAQGAEDPGIAAHKPHLAPPPPEPTFASREQTVKYYGTLVDGERRALRVVQDAISKAEGAPGGGGGWEHLARLQAMREDYEQRIQRHQGKLEP